VTAALVGLIVGLLGGFALGWFLKPAAGGRMKGRCNAELAPGRYCRKKPARGERRCGRHPENGGPPPPRRRAAAAAAPEPIDPEAAS